MSKADIYKEFGIEYKRGYINSPVYGWIRPLLINGNAKLGRGVWTWSTLPTNQEIAYFDADGVRRTEKGTCPCKCNGCYACGGCYTFNSTKASLARKTVLSRLFLDFVRRAIIAQIRADKITICRIHAAGDFFSIEYINAWRDIVNACPDTVFWSYTKNPLAECAFDSCPNCNIVKSIIPGIGFNYGHAGYLIRVYNALTAAGKSVYICRCGIDKNQHCTNCHHCAESEFVLFLEHGTAYDPESDPDFPTFVALVESQAADAIPAAAD